MYLFETLILASIFAWGTTGKKSKEPKFSIVYGGVLNKTVAVNCESDEIQNAAKFAVHEVIKFWPKTFLYETDGNLKIYSIEECTSLEVVYSRDGRTATVIRLQHPYEFDQVVETELHWGYTYNFKISWPFEQTEQQSETIMKYVHSFTVAKYIDDELYLYQHSFVPQHLFVAIQQDLKPNFHPTNVPISTKEDIIKSSVFDTCASSCLNLPSSSIFHSATVEMCPLQETQKFCQITIENENNMNYNPLNQYSLNTIIDKCSDVFKSNVTELKILSFNIWNTNTVEEDDSSASLYKERIKHIAKICNQVDADVIGFQEVRFEEGKGGSYGPNQMRHLSTLLKKYQYVYQPAQIQEHGIPRRIEEGVAIFSKFPIMSHDYLLLSRKFSDKADNHQRLLLHAEIYIPQIGPIHVFNTHLSLSHVARQRTSVEMWNKIQEYHADPVFLLGDFNAEAHNDEVKFLDGSVSLHGVKTHRLHDVWLSKHGTSNKGFTFNTLEDELTKRIDLIFMKEHKKIDLLDVEIIDDKLRGKYAASDHLALLATFKLSTAVK